MPVKVNIIDEAAINALPSREVEIPDKCPGCGADLTEPEAIREGGFVWYSSPCYIAKDGAGTIAGASEDVIESDGFEESFDAGTIVVGYLCHACDLDLAKSFDKNAGPRPEPKAVG
jgi:hypothetical protein